jgi:hypothetical protein
VSDARVQLAQLIEDPALALAIAHALHILCRNWEAGSHVVGQAALNSGLHSGEDRRGRGSKWIWWIWWRSRIGPIDE